MGVGKLENFAQQKKHTVTHNLRNNLVEDRADNDNMEYKSNIKHYKESMYVQRQHLMD